MYHSLELQISASGWPDSRSLETVKTKCLARFWCLACLTSLLLASCTHVLNWRAQSRRHEYTVKRGDTLYSIAWHYDVDYRQLAAWNRIASPYLIYPGERIQVAGAPPVNRPAVTTPTLATSRPSPLARHRYRGPWVWPAAGEMIGHFTGQGVNGSGIDIAGKANETIVAAHSGRVVYVGSGLPGYGRLIIIRDSAEYLSAYAFNQQIRVVEGMVVKTGQPIADMGLRNGRALLHFEIRRNGHPINPLTLLPDQ